MNSPTPSSPNLLHVAKFTTAEQGNASVHVGVVENQQLERLDLNADYPSLSAILNAADPLATAHSLRSGSLVSMADVTWLPPIDQQEVWAAGVTYKKSQTARMEESETAASVYDMVYEAERPELFFKAPAYRVCGHEQPLRIRADATWNVPEPEITLVLTEDLRIVGLTIGNDMSSRDIEGENPLYLPQAKCYDQSAGLGPWVTLLPVLPALEDIRVHLRILRDGEVVFEGKTAADQMARQFHDLVQWLGRDMTFPGGAFLMTGTGIVPTSAFTLAAGDVVDISITPIGTLRNSIVQGS